MLKQSFLVSLATMLSRIVGLIRDILIANYFGASLATDAFFLSFRIPNFFRRIVAEGSFTQAFVPVLKEYNELYNQAQVRILISQTFVWLGLITLGISVLGATLSPFFIDVYAFGFSSQKETLALNMLRILFPYLLFITLTAYFAAIYNTFEHFFWSSINPLLLNVSMIIGISLSYKFETPIYALAWSVLAGGVVQLVSMSLGVYRLGVMPPLVEMLTMTKPKFHPGVIKTIKLIVPTLLTTSVMQINVLIGMQIASFLPSKNISWLSYADRLMSLPWALIAVAVSTVILPVLSSLSSKARQDVEKSNKNINHFDEFNRALFWAVNIVFLFGLPSAIGLFVLSHEIVATLFMYGALLKSDVNGISVALMAYSIGLLFLMLNKVLSTSFFSLQNSKIVAKISIVSIICNVIASFALFSHFEHVGLALAMSISAVINTFLLVFFLIKGGYLQLKISNYFSLLRIIIASVFMAFLLLSIREYLSSFYGISFYDMKWFWRVIFLLLQVIAGGSIYFLILYLLGWRVVSLRYRS